MTETADQILEWEILERILFVGGPQDVIPSALVGNYQGKFVCLGTPADMLEAMASKVLSDDEVAQVVGYLTVAIEDLHKIECGQIVQRIPEAIQAIRESRSGKADQSQH